MTTRPEEIVIRTKTPARLPPDVRACPDCGGRGKNADGSFSASSVEVRYRPASDCRTCEGIGKVRVEAYRDGGV